MATSTAIADLVQRLEATGFVNHPIEVNLRSILLGIPSRLPKRDVWSSVFREDYEPGTFSVEERRTQPAFVRVEDDSTLEEWVVREAYADLKKVLPSLERTCPWQLPASTEIEEIPYKALEVLESTLDGEHKLTEEIYQQEYTDVLRRINLIYLTGWPRLPFNEYDEINRHMFALGVALAQRSAELDLSTLLKMSIVAGLVGLNHKSNASATSLLYHSSVIPVDFSMPLSSIVDNVFSSLRAKCREEWAIDSESQFAAHLLDSAGPYHLVFFPDDLLETIVDLKLMERLLGENKNLDVHIVPRSVRVGNDAGVGDIYHALHNEVFSELAKFHLEGRFRIVSDGPLSGNVNGRRMSAPLVELVQASDCVFAKGARSYECLQGLKKDSFFGFSVCRSISESVTGVDAETGGLVLIYQEAGEKSFEGFRQRHLRPTLLHSGRQAWLAAKTTLDRTVGQ